MADPAPARRRIAAAGKLPVSAAPALRARARVVPDVSPAPRSPLSRATTTAVVSPAPNGLAPRRIGVVRAATSIGLPSSASSPTPTGTGKARSEVGRAHVVLAAAASTPPPSSRAQTFPVSPLPTATPLAFPAPRNSASASASTPAHPPTPTPAAVGNILTRSSPLVSPRSGRRERGRLSRSIRHAHETHTGIAIAGVMGGEAAVERDPPTTTTATALKSANPEHALRRSKVIRGNEAPGIHTRANAGVGTSAPVMQGSSSSSSVSGLRDRPLQFEQRPGRSHRGSYPTTCMTTTDGKENEMIGDDDQGDNADHEDVVGRSPSFSSLRRTRGSQAPSDSDSDSGSTMSTAASESELDAAVSSSSRNDASGSPLSPPVEVNVSAQVRRRIVEEEDAKRSRKIADLEISNQSLMTINRTLEADVARKNRLIAGMKRQLRASGQQVLALDPGDEEDGEMELEGKGKASFASDRSRRSRARQRQKKDHSSTSHPHSGSSRSPSRSRSSFTSSSSSSSDDISDFLLSTRAHSSRLARLNDHLEALIVRGREAVARVADMREGGRGRVWGVLDIEGGEDGEGEGNGDGERVLQQGEEQGDVGADGPMTFATAAGESDTYLERGDRQLDSHARLEP